MKNKITPTQKQIELPKDSFIVSKTDTKGKITYCNRLFIEIAGYTEKELLGQQHNIVRHPDMPRAVFHMLWECVQKDREFMGYVKNMTKNGDYYWVQATVSSVQNSRGTIQGYSSIRRHPRKAALDIIEPIYMEMKKIEEQSGSKDAIKNSAEYLTEKLGEQSYEEFVFSI